MCVGLSVTGCAVYIRGVYRWSNSSVVSCCSVSGCSEIGGDVVFSVAAGWVNCPGELPCC